MNINLIPRWMREPEDEYITRIRRHIVLWDRWRFLMILFHVIILIFAVCICPKMIQTLFEMAEPANKVVVIPSITAGATFGFFLGFLINFVFFGLMLGVSGFRSERLLLKHYDAHNSKQTEESETHSSS